MKIALSPAKLILIMSFLALATACKKQSSPIQSSENAKKIAETDENNPLNFTVEDIKKNYTNVQGPNELPDHPGWFAYQAERNGATVYFWVKNKAVYSVSFSHSQNVESLLLPYANGKSWKYMGVGAIAIFRVWQRDDKEAWCEAVTNKQMGFTDIAIKTKAANRITHSPIPTVTATTSDTSPSLSQGTVGADENVNVGNNAPIRNIETLKAFLRKGRFTMPASMFPMQGDILLSGERSSIYVKDIYLIVDVRGADKRIESVSCMWWAVFSKTADGKRAGQSCAEWRQLISDIVGGDTSRLDEWVKRCNMRWISEPTGEMVTDSTEINGVKYEFSGSTKTALLEVEITPIPR